MKENISPEERLLKLIKGEKKSTAPNLAREGKVIDNKITSNISVTRPRIKDFLYSFVSRYFTLPYIQKFILVIMIVSSIYLIISFIYPWLGLKKIRLPNIPAQKVEESKLPPEEKPKSNEDYLQGLNRSQIFISSPTPETTAVSAVPETDLIKDINLVGIISGENPQAVIENKKTQKTYYLNKGQFIGEFQIEDIQEGKIILNYKGKKYELHL